ncbi:Dockerin type I repeat protein [Roseimaritima multifibrata]|uniref:Dockerin type I repeat protein n=1 Tax=Roseimaritima multifibrata TaxID=1930274 RepID=A0A517ME73_9BACT|nr:GEVED domain-containing protein [Roseimaritima multifibrata]QDS93136.1 Dockerin type I repeat protein [Roseimaritima multifibrata]
MVKSAKNKASRRQTKSGKSMVSKRRLIMESLEARQLLAAGITPVASDVNPAAVVTDTENPRNIGSVTAFIFNESEQSGQTGLNNGIFSAEVVPLGTMSDQEPIVDVTGTLSLVQTNNPIQQPEDVDYFAVDLRAGDILDLATIGGAGSIDVFYENGSRWFAMDSNQHDPLLLPDSSPLQTNGTVAGAQVVPEDGRYYVRVAPNGFTGVYTLGMRAYRPYMESQPIGTKQIVYVDFDGYVGPRSVIDPIDLETGLPNTGTIRIDSLYDYITNFGLLQRDEDALIDRIMARVHEDFNDVIPVNGSNGDYANTGIAGQFGITILNSRDHADPIGVANVTRVIVGGTNADIFTEDLLGISESIDIGNFDTSEIVYSPLDQVLPYTAGITISGAQSTLDLVAQTIAVTVTHELGHSFGLRHTDGNNNIGSMIDGPGAPVQAFDFELGPDGIFGTEDDQNLEFPVYDRFSTAEGFFGYERVADAIAFGLSTGTVGGSVTGTVFRDVNGDGLQPGDSGLAGVTVFVDSNGNGQFDSFEPRAVSGSDGTYTINGAPGATTVSVVVPSNSAITTASTQSVVIPTTGTVAAINFGVEQIRADVTGVKFADINGNGFREATEPGIEGVFMYIDLDNDDWPDTGEPQAITAADGSYSFDFDAAGTYTIREVVGPGYIQTTPASGEHIVQFTGEPISGQDFGNQPARDYGDADVASTVGVNAASHGLVAGLFLGASVDLDANGGVRSANADADDLTGILQANGTVIDDEDGVIATSAFGRDDTATLQITATNTTGQPGYLQAWIDFNGNGSFDDAGEHVIVDQNLANGLNEIDIAVPADAVLGSVVGRFRYSAEAGVASFGPTDAGEVEDHLFTVLNTSDALQPDTYRVDRNSTGNLLDVLDNDFVAPGFTLKLNSLDTSSTTGTAIQTTDGTGILYTPPNGFIGRDTITYFAEGPDGELIRDSNGDPAQGVVSVNVTFQTDLPFALDDTFLVPENSVNFPLSVLDNDISSINGGLSIVSFEQGDQGGRVDLVGGGQSLRYTPSTGFNGTEQFSYTIIDGAGNPSTAQVTLKMLPTSQLPGNNDVEFSFAFLDDVDRTPVDNVTVGDYFLVQVSVEDIELTDTTRQGVGSAFLDLLYSDELVSVTSLNGGANGFPFDIDFGAFYVGGSVFQQGDAGTPGIINEVGGTQPISALTDPNINQTGANVLFTIRMKADSAGVATFQADPADLPQSEVILLGEDTVVPVERIILGSGELQISDLPNGAQTRAIDDSFPDSVDSNGNPILPGNAAELDILTNDVLALNAQGSQKDIIEFGILTAPTRGNVSIVDTAGTPNDPSDDVAIYRPNAGVVGVDRFTYLIVDEDGFRSTAEVRVAIGAAANQADVGISFQYVDTAGNPVNSLVVGQEFGVEVYLDDLRSASAGDLGVFAGYLDVLYDRLLVTPSNNDGSDFGFDVEFSSDFNEGAAVGNLTAPGLINEFGAFQIDSGGSADPLGGEPKLMATLFFQADAIGTLRIVGDEADSSPFQDTLLYDPPGPVDRDRILFDVAEIEISVAAGESPFQNGSNPYDVNADGYVSPIDALGVINTLNQMSRSVAQGESFGSSVRKFFADVNGDSAITPIDALGVINFLNRQARFSNANGEAAPLVTKSNPSSASSDAVFESLSTNDVDADSPNLLGWEQQPEDSDTAVAANTYTADSSSSDDEEDDILALLADDVVTVWN